MGNQTTTPYIEGTKKNNSFYKFTLQGKWVLAITGYELPDYLIQVYANGFTGKSNSLEKLKPPYIFEKKEQAEQFKAKKVRLKQGYLLKRFHPILINPLH
ncbi:hypothetical protein [Nafulsella turpanensis]|uniref:hypothetical protein n=1 Tax=Nafulsella turpanensis TaxID=1265690 RepID=UPI0003714AF5|nr:hypothetical protein [Nafulsella turpanensis]